MKKRDIAILGGLGLLALFFLLKKDKVFSFGDEELEGGELPSSEEENYPDYSSWLDRNKIWLDPNVAGFEAGTTPITATEPIVAEDQTPQTIVGNITPSQTTLTSGIGPGPTSTGGGFDLEGALTDIATFIGVGLGIEGLKRLA